MTDADLDGLERDARVGLAANPAVVLDLVTELRTLRAERKAHLDAAAVALDRAATERERCAGIAETAAAELAADTTDSPESRRGRGRMALDIAARIRGQS